MFSNTVPASRSNAAIQLHNYERMLIDRGNAQRNMPMEGMYLQPRRQNPQTVQSENMMDNEIKERLDRIEGMIAFIADHVGLEMVKKQKKRSESSSPQKRISDIDARLNSWKEGKNILFDDKMDNDNDDDKTKIRMFTEKYNQESKKSTEGKGVNQMIYKSYSN